MLTYVDCIVVLLFFLSKTLKVMFALCDFLLALLGMHFCILLMVPVVAECVFGVFLYRVWFCCYVLDLLPMAAFMLFGAVVRYSNAYK